MSKVTMVGSITCQDGKADEMEAVLSKMVEAAREEPGVEIYSYHRGGQRILVLCAHDRSRRGAEPRSNRRDESCDAGIWAADGRATSDVDEHTVRRHRL